MFESLTATQRQLLAGAIEQKALFLKCESNYYAAVFDHGWTIWSLMDVDAPVYTVNASLTTCSCPVQGDCKHLKMLRHGSKWK